MNDYPSYLNNIIVEFSKLPGIGYRTAERLSMYMINRKIEDVIKFSEAIKNCKEKLKYCPKCGNFSEDKLCNICTDKFRNPSVICVVQEAKNIYAFEKTRNYRGVYHVLHGIISPNRGIGPDKLNIENLVKRVNEENVQEIILAINPSVEGEATNTYISRLFNNKKVKISRLAYGIPLGGDLEYIDDVTLSRALDFRQDF